MASPVTEIAIIPLAPGATIEDAQSSAGKVWQSTLTTISSQQGCQRAYFGRTVEDQSVVQLLIDWDSYEAHQDFTKSPIYGPFVKHLETILSSPISMNHAGFTPHPPSAATSSTTSPTTEVLIAYFATKNESFPGQFGKFLDALEAEAEGFKASAAGWVLEEVEHPSLGEGRKGNAFVGLIGWESVKAHLNFRETTAFRNIIHLLRGPEVKAMEMNHTSFTEQ